jgi:putative spermidine/putrescine transport system permease protein
MRLKWELLLLPAVFVFGVFYLIPMIIFVLSSFHPDLGLGRTGDIYTLTNFTRFLTDRFYLFVLWNTAKLSSYIVLISLILGFPVAYFLARSTQRLRRVVIPIVLMSPFVTLVIRAIGWVILLGNNGLVNRVFLWLGVVSDPIELLNHPRGVIVGMVHYVLPLMILAIMSVIQTIPPSLEHAAENLGANRLHVYTRVIFPLSANGILASSLLVFSLSMGVFASPLLLGGGKVYVLAILIYQEMMAKAPYATGAAMSLVLLVLVLIIEALSLAVENRYQSQRGRSR